MFSKHTDINIQPEPQTFSTLQSAYDAIRLQYHPDFICNVIGMKINSDINTTYYIDVMDQDTGYWAGFLGESNG